MGLANIELIQSDDADVSGLQVNIKKCINQFVSNPLLDGVVVNKLLSVGDNYISHGLNRKWAGWMIVDQNAPSTIYRNQGSSDATKTLVLNSSAACSVAVYIF